jgi:hypothetical protein
MDSPFFHFGSKNAIFTRSQQMENKQAHEIPVMTPAVFTGDVEFLMNRHGIILQPHMFAVRTSPIENKDRDPRGDGQTLSQGRVSYSLNEENLKKRQIVIQGPEIYKVD